jgi:hypothetical protein
LFTKLYICNTKRTEKVRGMVKYLRIDTMLVFRTILAQMSLLFANKAACKLCAPCIQNHVK